MKKNKKILGIALGIFILLTTTSLGKSGTVNAPNTLILRKEASKTSDVVTTLNDKTKIEIIEESGEWYKVKYNNYEGYLFAKYVDVVEEETKKEDTVKETETEKADETENKQQEYPKKVKTKETLKVYSIPSVTSKVTSSIEKEKEITINFQLNNWLNITDGKTTGWVRKYFVNNETSQAVETQNNTDTENKENTSTENQENKEKENEKTEIKEIDNKKGYVDVNTSANIREEANTSSKIINTLLRNTEVIITAEEGDFYKIKYKDIVGYISKTLISEKPLAAVTSRSSTERKVESVKNENIKETVKESQEKAVEKSNNLKGEELVEFAKKYIGYNYAYGGTTPSKGFDCSGFVYYIYNSCGYSLSRTCQSQANEGTEVSKQNLIKGDLIFFNNGTNGEIGHVGIYIGNGQIVHAANSRRGIVTDTINSGYYNNYYYTARRIIN